MTDKFRVPILKNYWNDDVPSYFDNFLLHCQEIARQNGWSPATVMNYQLRPLGGKLIITKTQGWYLRWDKESSHTAFVLRWTS
jgi:hypothetical protein